MKLVNHLTQTKVIIWNDHSNAMSDFGKNPTAFWGTRKREQRIGKSFKSFIYFLICRNLCADCYIQFTTPIPRITLCSLLLYCRRASASKRGNTLSILYPYILLIFYWLLYHQKSGMQFYPGQFLLWYFANFLWI